MARERRTRSWWQGAVARWERSGLSARDFAEREGVSSRTLYWWSSALRRGTRAERGSNETAAIAPIEIALPATVVRTHHVEIAIEGAVVRVEVGADVRYVCDLVRRLGTHR
jgi:transposase